MKQLQNQLRMAAQLAGQGGAHTRFGQVTGYDGFSCATVRLEPEGADTGWLPIRALQVGGGWGIVAAPSIGDVASIEFQEGDSSAGMITGFYYNDGTRSPQVPAGEFWVVRKDGGSLKFHNDGSVELHVTGNLTATTGGNLSATVAGDAAATITGKADVSVGGNLSVVATGTANYRAASHTFVGPVIMSSTLAVAAGAALNGGFSASKAGGGAVGVITGDVTATGTITGQTDVIAGTKSGKTHTHPNGTPNTGTPN